MKIVSFNVNSVRKRLHQLEKLTEIHKPDIIGLQETKVQDHDFPIEPIQQMGYEAIYMGQKTHYGVALLYSSKTLRLKSKAYGWPHDNEEAQKRLIVGDFETHSGQSIRVINGYFPQGENRNHEVKFPLKEKFYQDLMNYLDQHCQDVTNLTVMGDFNISPGDKDIGIGEVNRKRWLQQGKTSFLPEERAWWKTLMDWGFEDSFRIIYPEGSETFSWFDYRSKGFDDSPKRGLRIDTLLVNKTLGSKTIDSGVDYQIRGMEQPSDHAPVWSVFDL